MRKLAYGIVAALGLTAAGTGGAEEVKDKAVAQELTKFEGTWKIVSLQVEGKEVPVELVKGVRLTLRGDRFTYVEGKMTTTGTFKVDLDKKPKQIDIAFADGPEKGKTIRGIYELEGDTYKLCMATKGTDRPTAFESKPGSGFALEVLQRDKSAKPDTDKRPEK